MTRSVTVPLPDSIWSKHRNTILKRSLWTDVLCCDKEWLFLRSKSQFDQRFDRDTCNIYLYNMTEQIYTSQLNTCTDWLLYPPGFFQIFRIWGPDKIRRAALSNDAVQYDKMITNNYDWKLIVLILKNILTVKWFSTINPIATTELRIWLDSMRLLQD